MQMRGCAVGQPTSHYTVLGPNRISQEIMNGRTGLETRPSASAELDACKFRAGEESLHFDRCKMLAQQVG